MEDGAAGTDNLQPTYRGIIASAEDMLILVEACLSGSHSCISRPLTQEEKARVARSGNIFIYEVNASRINRWNDSLSWNRGKSINRCYLYRQVKLTHRAQQSAAKRKRNAAVSKEHCAQQSGTKRKRKAAVSKHFSASTEAGPATVKTGTDIYANNNNDDELLPTVSDTTGHEKQGKLDYVKNGLTKKVMSFAVGSMMHRVVSYYSAADAREQGKLQIPSMDPQFFGIKIRDELIKEYHKIPIGKHGRHSVREDLYGTGRYQINSQNPADNAGMPPLGLVSDAVMPVLNSYNSIASGSMPAVGSPHEASAQASYQHSAYTPAQTIENEDILASTWLTNEDTSSDGLSLSP